MRTAKRALAAHFAAFPYWPRHRAAAKCPFRERARPSPIAVQTRLKGREAMKHILIAAAALAVIGAPAAAMARAGFATSDVNMRAGPATDFPVITTIPAGADVNIHGCIAGYDWCDVGWSGDRGWVEASYLQFVYHDRRVLLPDYAAEVAIPIVTFAVD